MIKRYKKIISILLLPFFLTGCWDYRDINRRDIVISIGLDYKNGIIELVGESQKPLPPQAQNNNKTQGTSTYLSIASGKDIDRTRANQDANTPNPPFLGALRCIAFTKKYSKLGIKTYIHRLFNVSGFRNSVLVVITKETPKVLFKKRIENDISVGYGIESTIRYLDQNGAALYTTVQDIFSDINFKNIGYLLPYVTVSNHTVRYLGLAAMKNSKLAGIIEGKACIGFLLVLAKKTNISGPLPNPDYKNDLLSVKTTLAKRKIRTRYYNNKIHIYLDLKLQSQIQYEYYIKPLSKMGVKKIEKTIDNKVKKAVLAAVESSKNKFKCDVFGLARYFKADNPQAYKTISWSRAYPEAVFHVKAATTIINTNLLDLNAKKP